MAAALARKATRNISLRWASDWVKVPMVTLTTTKTFRRASKATVITFSWGSPLIRSPTSLAKTSGDFAFTLGPLAGPSLTSITLVRGGVFNGFKIESEVYDFPLLAG